MRYFDVGANLCGKFKIGSSLDNSFQGIYNRNIKFHEEDLTEVMLRAHKSGVDKLIIKGSCQIFY